MIHLEANRISLMKLLDKLFFIDPWFMIVRPFISKKTFFGYKNTASDHCWSALCSIETAFFRCLQLWAVKSLNYKCVRCRFLKFFNALNFVACFTYLHVPSWCFNVLRCCLWLVNDKYEKIQIFSWLSFREFNNFWVNEQHLFKILSHWNSI